MCPGGRAEPRRRRRQLRKRSSGIEGSFCPILPPFRMDANMWSRRECLRMLGAAAASAAVVPVRVTGVQLYSVRAALRKEPDRVLQALAGIGFKEVEGFSRPETVALTPKIKQYGLTVRSCQVETPSPPGRI